MQSIKDKVVVITGASRGIGAAIAQQMAREKAKLLLCGRSKQALSEVQSRLNLPSDHCAIVTSDLSQLQGVKKIVDTAFDTFGRVDIFINNAGVGVRKETVLTEDEEYDATFNTNVRAIFWSFKELIPRLKDQGGGHIINISSIAGKKGSPNLGVYCASKAAVNILSQGVAQEVRNDKIKISVVAPGSTGTGFLTHMSEDRHPSSGSKKRLTVEQVAEAVLHQAAQDENAWTSYLEIRPLVVKPE